MDTGFREEAKQIFNLAIALTADDRSAFVAKSCSSDKLKQEVNALLENYDTAGGFFDKLGEGLIPSFQKADPEPAPESAPEPDAPEVPTVVS